MSSLALATARRRPLWHLMVSSIGLSSLLPAACGPSAPAPAPPKPAAAQSTPKPAASPAAKPSPAAGASPQASPSPVAADPLQIVDATLADATPWVSIRLADGEPLIVSGWRLEVGSQSIVVPGNAIVQPGETLILHAGEGRSSEREVYLGPESYALALAATPGARVRLIDSSGQVAAETTVPRF